MVKRELKNPAASVHARLLEGARARREDFNLTLKRYIAERFLARLAQSPYRERFVLKGAMVFVVWGGPAYRATRDLDLMGYGEYGAEDLCRIVREIVALPSANDGLQFLPDTVLAEPIRDQSRYHGFRVKLKVLLGNARLDLQLDVGFGNAIEPPARDEVFPALLDGPGPSIRAYPREAVVAEKFQAMVELGEQNSRLKDFYDLHMLATRFSFDGGLLAAAVAATFRRRGTPIGGVEPVALASRFFAAPARGVQWRAYLGRGDLRDAPADFEGVGETLRGFLGPVWSGLAEAATFGGTWPPGGPWGPKVGG